MVEIGLWCSLMPWVPMLHIPECTHEDENTPDQTFQEKWRRKERAHSNHPRRFIKADSHIQIIQETEEQIPVHKSSAHLHGSVCAGRGPSTGYQSLCLTLDFRVPSLNTNT